MEVNGAGWESGAFEGIEHFDAFFGHFDLVSVFDTDELLVFDFNPAVAGVDFFCFFAGEKQAKVKIPAACFLHRCL